MRRAVMMLVLLGCWQTGWAAMSLDHQREQFKLAMQDLDHGRDSEFLRRERLLKDYPLHGYLRYAWLRKRIDSRSDQELSGFLRDYADWPIAGRLRSTWLRSLARKQRWQTLLQVYRGRQSTSLQCYKAQAELAALGNKPLPKSLQADIETLWLVGKSRPDACNKPFKVFKQRGLLSDDRVWQRAVLSIRQGQVKLARYLQRSLKDLQRRRWVDRWLDMRAKPEQTLATLKWKDDASARSVIDYGMQRLANRDAAAAHALWTPLQQRYRFGTAERDTVAGKIALHGTLQGLPEARQWMAALANPNASERGWALRGALREQDWQGVLQAWGRLLPEQQGRDQWRYWRARALEALDRPGAELIFVELATRRGYHSFLAADRIGKPYQLGDQPLSVAQADIAKIASIPGIRRAGELYRLQRGWEARSEWGRALSGMNRGQLQAAAELAASWGWSDRAIATLAKSGDRDALALRFPLAHRDTVDQQAGKNGLDPSWVFGVIRQESAFIADVTSPVGAMGLMQLMPATGRRTAKLLKQRLRHLGELKQPERNIQLGSAYLADVSQRLDGNPVLATAAYNAGPHRVVRWLPEQPLEAGLWVELIPYKETRRYVKAVFAFAAIYDWRRGRPIIPLQQRMPEVQPASPVVALVGEE